MKNGKRPEIIREYDTSLRSTHHVSGSRWARTHSHGPQVYRRLYQFPYRVYSNWSGSYSLTSDSPRLRRSQWALGELGLYVREEMKGQIERAMIGGNNLEISLTKRADREWQQERPEAFYQELGSFCMRIGALPEPCEVVRAAPIAET